MPDNPQNRILTEKAIREYAEREVPNSQDPWPGIRQRIQAVPARREAGPRPEPERTSASGPGHRWLPRLVPGTPLGYALAVLSVLILAVGVYAASEPIRELSQHGLPGGVGSGERSGSESQPGPDEQERGQQGVPDEWAEDLLRQTASEIAEADLDVRLNETRTVGGITVTLERAYADEDNVVIVYSASGWNNQPAQAPGPAVISLTRLEDGSGTTYEPVASLGAVTDPADQSVKVASEAAVEFFDPSEKLEFPGEHNFRLNLELDPSPGQSADGAAEELKTLTFDFSIPVRGIDVIDVGQTVEANGIRMTLARVENSPARTQAFLCFDPPQDEKYNWLPLAKRPIIDDFFMNASLWDTEPEAPTGCVSYDLYRSLYDKPGVHSFTVTEIEGRTHADPYPERTIRGPWTFEFEVPER
jgi:hypothetical protein